tara:strand:- start:206616 stop:209822 length:3207 start_codon:yes stop_codon:yes gene_type:complete
MRKLYSIITLLGGFGLLQAQNTFVVDPQLSPNQKSIAFSYQGDIWIMDDAQSVARRLTVHEAYDASPFFSPDGKSIAFSSNRYGNNDIFTIPVQGGSPQRLNYHSASDNINDWSKDWGILFASNRDYNQIERDPEIHSISPQGGNPKRILDALGDMASASPDGRYIAFAIGTCRISRENYSGPADNDIWLYDSKEDTYIALSDNSVNDIYPHWASSNELVYLSSKDGRYNLKKINIETKEEIWLSDFSKEGIHYFSLAGDKLLYAKGPKVYFGELQNLGAAKELKINLATDYRFYPTERESFRSGISDFSISPSGDYALIEIRGELFIKNLDKEESRTINLSKHPYFDREAILLNDEIAVFSSDRANNQYQFYTASSQEESKPELFKSLRHQVKDNLKASGDLRDLNLAPNGKKVCYTLASQKLIVADISEKGEISNPKVLVDAWYGADGVAWSPDSRFIAYSHSDLNFNTEVFIQSVEGGEEVNISMHPGSDYAPFWSADGSKLAFISDRNNDDADVWFAWLNREDWLKSEEEREQGYYFSDKPEEEKESEDEESDKKDKKKDKEVEPITIDLDNIHRRLQQVTSFIGGEGNVRISKDGETFYFTRYDYIAKGSDLYKVKYDGSDLEQISKGGSSPSSLMWDKDYKGFYGLSRGQLKHINAESGKVTAYPHEAKMTLDKQEERKQVFDEGWRLINQRFYDPNFHGEDWEALKDYYRPWALSASTNQDFQLVYNLMLGRLNASHMGLYGSGEEDVQRERTGRLGIEFETTSKGLKVTRVIPNSPADRAKNNLMVGDVITSINGESISDQSNFYESLVETAGDPLILELESTDGKKEIVIRPSSSVEDELYEEWVADRAKLVDEYSNGRLGYIHIKGMDKPSFERFERELMASGYGKEGIVIDVRYNGGGWTTDYLMAVLSVRQHAYTIPRGAASSLEDNQKFKDFYPYSERLPLAAWTKPSIALCNESSYSNAEIFSHAYKTLGIGTLVGQPTFGAVISTGGSSLLNGAFIRLPFRAWYVKATGENMENGPAVPDILVENHPASRARNEDAQLKVATETLLKQIDNKQ